MTAKLKLCVIGGVVLVALIGAGTYLRGKKTDKGLAITTEKAAIRTITQVVTATGKIQPEKEVKISPEIYGEIIELPYREGMRVKKGEPIVRIKPDLYQAQVDQQAAAVASARGGAVKSSANVEKAKADLKQYEDLYRRKLVSDADYTLYKTAYDIARADQVSALANVQQQEGLLSSARDQLSKTVIYAPIDGTVSSRSSEVGERVVATQSFTGTEIMRLADLTNMEVQVNVNENDMPNVKVGDHAVISIDAYPDRKFNGFVKEIASSSENTGATGSGTAAQSTGSTADEVTNFLVKIRVADRDVQLRPGMSATADIETQTAPNVVAVPIQSVTVRASDGLNAEEFELRKTKEAQEKSGNDLKLDPGKKEARRDRDALLRVVFVRTGGTVKLRPVETGIADDTYIEVKHGVQPGDEIVSGTYAAISRKLKNGSVVHLEQAKPKTAD